MSIPDNYSKDINYRTLIKGMREGVAFCRIIFDENHAPSQFILADYNPSFETLFSSPKMLVPGLQMREIIPGILNQTINFSNLAMEVNSTGESRSVQYFSQRTSKWISLSINYCSPDVLYIIVYKISDITPQYKFLRNVLDMSPDLIVITNMYGQIIDCNIMVLKKFGFDSKESILNTNALLLISEKSREKANLDMMTSIETGFDGKRYFFNGKDGEFAGEMSSSVIRDNKGNPITRIYIVKDMTAVEKMQEDFIKLTRENSIIFNSTQDALALIDVEDEKKFTYSRVNRASMIYSGINSKNYKGLSFKDLFVSELAQSLEVYYMECVREKKPISYEKAFELPSGKKVWHTVLSPVIKDNKVTNIVTSIRDITAIKSAEDALEKERDFLNTTLLSICDGVIATDINGNITLLNKTAQLLTGWSEEEAKGKQLEEVFNIYNEETGELAINPVKRVLEEGQIVGLANHTLLISRDGRIRSISDSAAPIRDYNGNIQGVILIFRDVTAIKEAQDALQASEEKMRSFFACAPYPIMICNLDGVIIDCNSEEIKLNEVSCKEELLGKSIFEMVLPKDKKNVVQKSKNLLEKGSLNNEEYTIKTNNGTEKVLEVSSSLIYNKDGKPNFAIIISKDITDRKKAEAEIKYLSFHDKLTGLYNRAYFEKELERIDTERQLPISVIVGDLNGLKLTNDIFGHTAGDRLLRRVAKIMKSSCRQEDVIARWGGDEFAIILPKTQNDKAVEICERIIKLCNNSEKRPIQPSIALGYATKEKQSTKMSSILEEAENWMYRHKLLDSNSARSSVIASLEKTLFEKSYETEEHAQRINHLCNKLGKALGLSSTEMDALRLLSLLHDIGKIAISDNILLKPGRLSDEEWKEMKKHTEIGFRIAQSSQELSYIAEYILYHHERWDGTGYPHGLKGHKIPKLSRIITIIDSYDVMTHSRPYKGVMTHTEAIDEIRRCTGTQFDPEIAQLFIKIMNEEI